MSIQGKRGSIYFSDAIFNGIWSKLDDIQDTRLKSLAGSLPTLLENKHSTSTLQKYKPAWKKWVDWSSSFSEVSSCPADPFYVALYFNDIVSKDGKVGSITAAFLGIRWGHLISGFPSPTDQLGQLAYFNAKKYIGQSAIFCLDY